MRRDPSFYAHANPDIARDQAAARLKARTAVHDQRIVWARATTTRQVGFAYNPAKIRLRTEMSTELRLALCELRAAGAIQVFEDTGTVRITPTVTQNQINGGTREVVR